MLSREKQATPRFLRAAGLLVMDSKLINLIHLKYLKSVLWVNEFQGEKTQGRNSITECKNFSLLKSDHVKKGTVKISAVGLPNFFTWT